MAEKIKNLRKNIRLWVQLSFTALTNGYVTGFLKGKIYQKAQSTPSDWR